MNNVVPIVPVKVRLLAALAGCFSAVWGVLVFGWPFAVVPVFLILGAIIQPRSPLPGKWLMWVGAFLLSMVVLPIGTPTLFAGIRGLGFYHDTSMIVTFSLSLASVLLVVCCDATLLYSMTLRNNHGDIRGSSRRTMTWLVWVAALVLTVYLLVMSMSAFQAYRTYGRLDLLLTWVSLSLVALLFDIALAVRAVRRIR